MFEKLNCNDVIFEIKIGRLRTLVRETFYFQTGYGIFHCDSIKHIKVILY